MEEDILKYSPTVMFRGTPCMSAIANQTAGPNGLTIFEGILEYPGGNID